LSDVLGVSSLVDALHNPTVGTCTASSVLGPFYNDAPPESVYLLRQIMKYVIDDRLAVQVGESIASEGKGDYMLVEGRILSRDGQPIPGAVIDTWEADGHGPYYLHSQGLI
jgi:protocatechuate 3,4-dioxygenase beta subunit